MGSLVKKQILARGSALCGLQWCFRKLTPWIEAGSIRAILSHSVPHASVANYRKQLEHYREQFCDVSYVDLARLLETGRWDKPKPGLIISFDDGLRSHAEVAAPLLEEFGFTGWFFLPYEFLDTPEEDQRKFALDHRITLEEDLPGPRVAMTWDQARALQENHVVGCHTASHCRLESSLTDAQRSHEIASAKLVLQERLGRTLDTFAWVGGEEWAYSRSAAIEIARSEFRFSFMTNSVLLGSHSDPLKLDRTQIESDWPMEVVRLQLSGIMDLAYLRKRRRVHRLTSVRAMDGKSGA